MSDKKNESEKEIGSNGRDGDQRGERLQTKREIYVLGGERKVNKISKIFFGIDVCTVSYLRRYCSDVVKCLRFKVLDEDWFLVFGVPNAKYLAFGTPDGSALIVIQSQIKWLFSNVV